MNICFFISEIPNLTSGGVENVTYRLATSLQAKGYNVYCLTSAHIPNNYDSCFTLKSIDFNNTSSNKQVIDLLLKYKINIVINQSVELKWYYILNDIRLQIPDIALIKVLHTDPAYLIKGIRDKEPLYTNSGGFPHRFLYRLSPITILRRYRRSKYTKKTYQEWIKLYDQVVLLSDKFISDFKQLARCTGAKNISYISNPIELTTASILNKKEKIVLYVGRMYREAKRPDRLLAIWKKIYQTYPDWQLIYVGDGPIRSNLENYCIKHNITNVNFVGQTNPTPYYQKASILCITSTYEGFGLVCGEALANGVIPIAFNSFGAIQDLINDGCTGLLVTPFKLNEYANKLSKVISTPLYMETLRKNIIENKDFKIRYSIESITHEWELLFKKLYRKLN